MASSKQSMNMRGTNGTDDEVDTDQISPLPSGDKDDLYDSAVEAMPDLTSSGDNVHMGAAVSDTPLLSDEEKEKLESEMKQVENDISVLQDVLHNKIERLHTIRRTLGLETSQNYLKSSFYRIKDSDAYVKTSEKLSEWKEGVQQSEAYQKTGVVLKTAGEKTKETFTTVGATVSKKLGDMRNSNTFKSFEERMGSAYSSVKSRISGSRSEDDLGSVNATLPEQKVPM